MEERKEIVKRYVEKGMTVSKAAGIAGFSRSSYYYKSKGGVRGRRPSTETLKKDGKIVDNKVVIETIKEIIGADFIDYGYEKVTVELRKREFVINKKKVYRLMKENGLLNHKIKGGKKSGKNYVKYTQPCPAQPFEKLEIDIKYIYIRGDRRNAYLTTILDTFTRKALVWDLAYTMKAERVIKLIERLISEYLQPEDLLNRNISVTMRNDNGSQFIAKIFRRYLQENQIFQEFTKPATPEQNAHIESFHSTVERLVCQKFEFESLKHAREIFEKFYQTYNDKRILKCLLYQTPSEFTDMWNDGKLAVVYDIKSKKQHFLLTDKIVLMPVPLIKNMNLRAEKITNTENKNNLYIVNHILSK